MEDGKLEDGHVDKKSNDDDDDDDEEGGSLSLFVEKSGERKIHLAVNQLGALRMLTTSLILW